MYERPELHEVGKAEEIIQGIFPSGPDIDGNDYTGGREFAEESPTDPA